MKKGNLIQLALILNLLGGILYSCALEDKIFKENLSVDVKCIKHADTFFSKMTSYAKLETNNQCILDKIQSLKIIDNKILVLNKDKIFVFDLKGKYLYKIDKRGKGHGEYLDIRDFTLRDSKYYIMSGKQESLLCYNEDNIFVGEYPLGNGYEHFEFVNDDLIFLSSENNNRLMYNFVLYDIKKKTIIKKYFPFKKTQSFSFSDFSAFCGKDDNHFYVTNAFDNSIYSLCIDSIANEINFSFNTALQLPEDYEEINFFDLYKQTSNKNVVRYIKKYYSTTNYYYITYSLFDNHGVSPYLSRISKKKKETISIALNDEVHKNFPYFGKVSLFVDDNTFVTVKNAEDIIYVNKHFGNDIKKMIEVKETDNPVVFFYKLKE